MTVDMQQRCKDGRLKWTEIVANPIRDALENSIGYQGIT